VAVPSIDTELRITGEGQEAGECDWSPVKPTNTNQAGFILGEFIKPVPS
jgi:hypothetical protein